MYTAPVSVKFTARYQYRIGRKFSVWVEHYLLISEVVIGAGPPLEGLNFINKAD